MKKFSFALVAALAIAAISLGQAAGPRGGSAGQGGKGGDGKGQQGQRGPGGGRMMRMGGDPKMRDEMFKKIGLSEAQKTKWKAADEKAKTSIEALMKGMKQGERPSDAVREKFKAVGETHKKAIEAIMTKEQKVKYEAYRKEMMEKFRKQGGGRPGGPGGPGGPPPGGAAGGAKGGKKGGGN